MVPGAHLDGSRYNLSILIPICVIAQPSPVSKSLLVAADPVDTLYRDHHRWLVALLRRKLGNIDHAADLAHDTFERILKVDLRVVLPEPRAYLTRVASNLAVSHVRRASLEQAYLAALSQLPEPMAPSPEDRMLVMEALSAISAVLDGMAPRARDIFLLSQLDGLGYAEIAAQQGMTVKGVQKSMSKALQHCYAALYA